MVILIVSSSATTALLRSQMALGAFSEHLATCGIILHATHRLHLRGTSPRRPASMIYDFLTETYETERIKVISVWSMFRDEDLPVRPHPVDLRGRSVREQMVHQCVSEDLWFRNILGIDVGAPPLPSREIRWEFIRRYAEDSGKRLTGLREKREPWWGEIVTFFDVPVRARG